MSNPFDYEIAVVGAGPAGVGTAVALEHLDVEYAVLERDCIGASFRQWPDEMRLLTPSFPANAFGVRDLNAVTVDTSPALALDCEHPTGDQYAAYLEAVAEFHDLPIETGVDVERVAPEDESDDGESAKPASEPGFTLETADGPVRARYVVWAAGQYQYPADGSIPGATHAVHVSTIESWERHAERVSNPAGEATATAATEPTATTGTTSASRSRTAADGSGIEPPDQEDETDDVVVVGGAESGIDAALGLADAGLSVTVLDDEGTWQFRSPDPSEVLSPRTNERLERALNDGRPIELVAEARADRIERVSTDDSDDRKASDRYAVITTDDERYDSRTPPLLATGFEGSLSLVDDLFAFEGDHPSLTDRDESTETPGLFLAGPQVAHGGQQFCFIYKFRQRFAVVAETIGDRLGVDTDPLEAYHEKQMIVEDPECCDPEYCDC